MTETLATQLSDNCSAHATVNWWLTQVYVWSQRKIHGTRFPL